MISKLFVISGIIISSTKPYIKASKLKLQCKSCLNTKTIELSPGQNPYVPSFCDGVAGHNQKCPKDSFIALPLLSIFSKLKGQILGKLSHLMDQQRWEFSNLSGELH